MEDQINFTTSDGQKHEMSIDFANAFMKVFFDEYPGGLAELDAHINKLNGDEPADDSAILRTLRAHECAQFAGYTTASTGWASVLFSNLQSTRARRVQSNIAGKLEQVLATVVPESRVIAIDYDANYSYWQMGFDYAKKCGDKMDGYEHEYSRKPGFMNGFRAAKR